MLNRNAKGSWAGPKLRGDEIFFADLRDSVNPVIGRKIAGTHSDIVSHCFDYQGNLVNVAEDEERIVGARYLAPGWTRRRSNGISFNPDTTRGIIVEQASQNEILYFDDIDNAYWTRNNLNATSGTGTSIAGRAAKGLIGDATTAPHNITRGLTVQASKVHTISGLFSAGDNNHVYLRLLEFFGFTNVTAWFNLATGAVGTVSASTANLTVLDTSITKVNGGYWCTFTFSLTQATTVSFIYGSSAADNADSFLGDNATVNLWACALQAEIDRDNTVFPTLPMLGVEGSASTREIEIIEYEPVYTETGAVACEFYLPFDPTIGIDPMSFYTFQPFGSDTVNSTRVHIAASGKLQFIMFPATGAGFGTIHETTLAITKGVHRFAATWKAGTVAFFVDGVEATAKPLDNAIMPTASEMDKFYLGSRSSAVGGLHQDQYTGVPIAYLKVYDKFLSNLELQQLTT